MADPHRGAPTSGPSEPQAGTAPTGVRDTREDRDAADGAAKWFTSPISQQIWNDKYRHRDGHRVHDVTLEDTWRRIARALAAVEGPAAPVWEERFTRCLEGFRFLPAGRIQAGAGTGRRVTLFNCFVMGAVDDSMEAIFEGLRRSALTMQQGGGIGCDFSRLRPRGTRARDVGGVASGPVSFMGIWDAMCETILSTGARRGAMMATLRCDHPDIEEFITAKRDSARLRHFNLSVLVSDDFMRAVRRDEPWPLVFPARAFDRDGEQVDRVWSGSDGAVSCRVVRRIRARDLWDRIMRATYDYAEPGVLFIDRINDMNNLWYCERISATNPCGEVPLPAHGACDLGSINLATFVRDAFESSARLDWDALRETARTATRMLDNVIDASGYPLEMQRERAQAARRIGLGLTGLADALILLGLRYGSPESLQLSADVMREITYTAYRTSIELAREKGAFPLFDRERFLEAPFVRSLPDDLRDAIAQGGIRNSHCTAIAPTGTVSLLANNVSSGLEPVFSFQHERAILELSGDVARHELEDYAARRWRLRAGPEAARPDTFVEARSLPARTHLEMQAALQPYVDSSISKTINVPVDEPFESFADLYSIAYDRGLKGCTTFRPNTVTGSVLTPRDDSGSHHCCGLDREID